MNKMEDNKIESALIERNFMDILSFIKFIDFDNILLNKLINRSICVDESIIEWMGYKREVFLDFLKCNRLPFEKINMDIVMPRDIFNQAVMLSITQKSKDVKKYCLDLEKILHMYDIYVLKFRQRETEESLIKKMEEICGKLRKERERAEKAEKKIIHIKKFMRL